jgi:hypothetical protein
MWVCMHGQVFVRKTITSPEFEFAYTDPTKDFDVSHHMAHGGGVELGITRVSVGGGGQQMCLLTVGAPLTGLCSKMQKPGIWPWLKALPCAACRNRCSTKSSSSLACLKGPTGNAACSWMWAQTLDGSLSKQPALGAGRRLGSRAWGESAGRAVPNSVCRYLSHASLSEDTAPLAYSQPLNLLCIPFRQH